MAVVNLGKKSEKDWFHFLEKGYAVSAFIGCIVWFYVVFKKGQP